MAHPLLTDLGSAIAKLAADRDGGRQALLALWETLDPDDHAGRCIVAHYVADAHDNVGDEIRWDGRALAESALVDDEDLRAIHPTLQVAGFLSSLHLNLADGYRRLGRFEEAAEHLAASRDSNPSLDGAQPEQIAYRQMIVTGQDYVAARIAARDSTALSYARRAGDSADPD
jgi:hypothetical protein